MPAVIQCTQCQRQLNVLEAHLGSLVRCPVCKTMFTAVAVGGPRPAMPAAGAPPAPPKATPSVPSPPVASYAPAPPPPAVSGPPAVAAYVPTAAAPPAVASYIPTVGASGPVADEDDPPWGAEPPEPKGPSRGEIYHSEFDEDEGVAQRAVRPHRAMLVLGAGVAGLVFFCIFPLGWILGGIAISLGANDLQEMSRGRMDRSGRQQTDIGRWCGVAAAVLATLVSLLWLFRLLVTTRINM